MERVTGIEPARPAWKAGVLPLNYTRIEAFTAFTLLTWAGTLKGVPARVASSDIRYPFWLGEGNFIP